jgi:hypothetical protein
MQRDMAFIAAGCVAALLALAGCQSIVYGTGGVFVWNGGTESASIKLEGRSAGDLSLAAGTGQLLKDWVAGPYHASIRTSGGAAHEVSFDLKQDQTALVNVEAKSCFARTDISGMYQAGKERVHFLAAYEAQELLLIDQPITVFPGEAPPTERPRGVTALQRLSEIPCRIVKDSYEITEHVRRQR